MEILDPRTLELCRRSSWAACSPKWDAGLHRGLWRRLHALDFGLQDGELLSDFCCLHGGQRRLLSRSVCRRDSVPLMLKALQLSLQLLKFLDCRRF
jgi:hypothetical protein